MDQRVISGTLASIQQVAEMEKPEGAHTVDYRWRRHAAQFAALVFASAELAFGGLRRLYSR